MSTEVLNGRKAKIVDALRAKGFDLTEENIAGVASQMEGRNIKYATAVERWANKSGAAANSSDRSKTTANRTRTSASIAQNRIQEKIDNARNAVRTSTKTQIIVGGISDALKDIAEGNFTDIELDAIAALDSFSQGWEETRMNLIEAEVTENPLLLPCASDSSFQSNNNHQEN